MNPNRSRIFTRKDRSSLRYHDGEHHYGERPGVVIDQSTRVPLALQPQPGTPVAAVAATGTTAMSGTNNDWDMTAVHKGTRGNLLSLAVAIQAGKYDAPTVAITGGAIVITAGNKARMSVAGMTADGNGDAIAGTIVFPYDEEANDKPSYALDADNSITWDGTEWQITIEGHLSFTSTEDVATPDLVTAWTAEGSATGTPAFTALNHTAAQGKTAFDATTANETHFTLANKAGNDGTGALATQAAVTLSGGVDGTVAFAGTEMFDADFRYLAVTDTTTADSSGWKKTALSAL